MYTQQLRLLCDYSYVLVDRCEMVDVVDELFKYFVANTYFAEVTVEFVLLYSLLDPKMPTSAKVHGIFWLCYIGAQTMTMSVAAVSINTQVRFDRTVKQIGTTIDRVFDANKIKYTIMLYVIDDIW